MLAIFERCDRRVKVSSAEGDEILTTLSRVLSDGEQVYLDVKDQQENDSLVVLNSNDVIYDFGTQSETRGSDLLGEVVSKYNEVVYLKRIHRFRMIKFIAFTVVIGYLSSILFGDTIGFSSEQLMEISPKPSDMTEASYKIIIENSSSAAMSFLTFAITCVIYFVFFTYYLKTGSAKSYYFFAFFIILNTAILIFNAVRYYYVLTNIQIAWYLLLNSIYAYSLYIGWAGILHRVNIPSSDLKVEKPRLIGFQGAYCLLTPIAIGAFGIFYSGGSAIFWGTAILIGSTAKIWKGRNGVLWTGAALAAQFCTWLVLAFIWQGTLERTAASFSLDIFASLAGSALVFLALTQFQGVASSAAKDDGIRYRIRPLYSFPIVLLAMVLVISAEADRLRDKPRADLKTQADSSAAEFKENYCFAYETTAECQVRIRQQIEVIRGVIRDTR